jgi:hypothetical protein
MAFAIFYDLGDLSSLAGTTQTASLPTNLKNEARKYWNGGLKDWSTAPVAQSPYEEPGACPNCRRVVITYGTLAAFRQLLYDIANYLGTEAARYLIALADDMGGLAGAVEPWPPV